MVPSLTRNTQQPQILHLDWLINWKYTQLHAARVSTNSKFSLSHHFCTIFHVHIRSSFLHEIGQRSWLQKNGIFVQCGDIFENHTLKALVIPFKNVVWPGRVKCSGKEWEIVVAHGWRKRKKLKCGTEEEIVVAHGRLT